MSPPQGDRGTGTDRTGQDALEDDRHAVVGDEVPAHLAPVAGADLGGRTTGDHRFGGEDAGEQRLADALSRQRIGRGGGIPDEQHRAVIEHRPVDASRDGPGGAPALGRRIGPEHLAHARAGEETIPDVAGVADGHPTAAQHAEADVGPAPGEGEAPRVAGQQVGLEPDVEVAGRRAHVGHVLAEGLPLAAVAVVRQAEEAPGR